MSRREGRCFLGLVFGLVLVLEFGEVRRRFFFLVFVIDIWFRVGRVTNNIE